MRDEMLIVDDPFAPELRMHPSDWERGADGRDKLRERREEIVRAFDAAMAGFGRDRAGVADRLAYIAAAVLSAGVGLGLDVDATMRLEVVGNGDADDDALDEPDADRRRLGEAVPTDYLTGPDGMMAVCVGQLGARLSYVSYGKSIGYGEMRSDLWDDARRKWLEGQALDADEPDAPTLRDEAVSAMKDCALAQSIGVGGEELYRRLRDRLRAALAKGGGA